MNEPPLSLSHSAFHDKQYKVNIKNFPHSKWLVTTVGINRSQKLFYGRHLESRRNFTVGHSVQYIPFPLSKMNPVCPSL